MGADEHTRAGHVTKQRVERGSVQPLLDRIDPDEDAVETEELLSDGLDGVVRVDDRLSLHAKVAERREDAAQLAIVRDWPPGRRRVPLGPPKQTDAKC